MPRQAVDCEAGCAFGKDGCVEGDVALEDEGVGLLFLGGGGAEVQGAGGVGGAVEVLGSGVAQVDGVGVDYGARAGFGLVVDDGGAVRCEQGR